jgi:hypothetical protein
MADSAEKLTTTGGAQQGTAAAGADRPRQLSQYQVLGLMVQFLLGMVLYMTGVPARARGGAHTFSLVILAAHLLLAAGLVAGAVLILGATAGTHDWRLWLARGGAAGIGTAAAAGLLTLALNNGWWSYVMAVGFTVALMAYGGLLIPATADAPAASGARPGR